jgi:hypothetical protein
MMLGWRLAALVLLAAVALGALADEVALRNGDRLRGEIDALADGILLLRTDYAGQVALRWSEVVSLATSRSVEVMLKGARTPARGTLQPLDGGRALLIAADGTGLELALADIAYINPKPGTSHCRRRTRAAIRTTGSSTPTAS